MESEGRRSRRRRWRELYALRERERASRWIARPFVERRRAAAFTSSEPFPSTFQIMRERNPRSAVPCPRIRVGTYHATRRAREDPLFLSFSFPFSLPSCREHVAATVLPERRDPKPDNEIEARPLAGASRNLYASNTPDDRAPAFSLSIQTPAGYFRSDVSRAECARVGFDYDRVLKRNREWAKNSLTYPISARFTGHLRFWRIFFFSYLSNRLIFHIDLI